MKQQKTRKRIEAAFIEPMQCKPVTALPAGENWTFQIKERHRPDEHRRHTLSAIAKRNLEERPTCFRSPFYSRKVKLQGEFRQWEHFLRIGD
jgi:hypothetical protein